MNLNGKYKVFVTILLLLVGLDGNGQALRDSIFITVDNYSKYLGLTCTLRENLIRSVKNRKTIEVDSLSQTIVVYKPCIKCQVLKAPLSTKREDILLEFFRQSYDELLKDIDKNADYFSANKRKKKDFPDPNFDCGNLTLGMLDFWTEQSRIIISEIEKSKLNDEARDLLILYWKSILLYIDSGEELSPAIREDATAFLKKYPNSSYTDFAKRLQSMKKVYRPNGMTLGFGLGKPLLVGDVANYLKGDFVFDFEFGYTYRGWFLTLGYHEMDYSYSDTLRLSRIDDLVISQSSIIEYSGAALKIGYSAYDKDWLSISPFVSGEVNKFVNYIEIPDSTGIRQKGNTHAVLSFGTELGIRIFKNIIDPEESNSLYFRSEEKDFFYNPLFLNIRLGYYPAIFNKPMGISGSSFYWTVGLEWFITQKQAYFVSRWR